MSILYNIFGKDWVTNNNFFLTALYINLKQQIRTDSQIWFKNQTNEKFTNLSYTIVNADERYKQ